MSTEPGDYQHNIQPVTNPETGQQEFKDPQHPLARKDGMVLLSRHLISVQVGRWLHPGEIVLYRDGNPQNLTKENLELTTLTKLAHGLRCNSVILYCPFCGLPFKVPPSHKNRLVSIAAPCVPEIAALICTTKRSVEGVKILVL
jgi:hypothetical protein